MTPHQKWQLRLVIFKFLAVWMFFLVILAGIAMSFNLEWARPRIQEELSATFHRKVAFGRLFWTFGLNGIAIGSDHVSILEATGAPFLASGKSEIGVAFLPLFDRRLIIRHIRFTHPVVYATQLTPDKWNFSDLILEGPEIRYIEVDDGQLHLRNHLTVKQVTSRGIDGTFANCDWKTYDFQSVNMKLIFPKKDQTRQWPFYLAFKLPGTVGNRAYASAFSMTLLANGGFHDWERKKCSVDIKADNFNPADLRPFFKIPPELQGLISLEFKGKGVISEAIEGTARCSVKDLIIQNKGNSLFSAPDAKCDSHLIVRPDCLNWDKTSIVIGGLKILSEGRVQGWNSSNASYDLTLSANLSDLTDGNQSVLSRFFPGVNSGQSKNAEKKGSAQIELAVKGDSTQQKMYTVLKANDLPLSHLLGPSDNTGAPLLSLFEIKPNAAIVGQIEISPEHVVTMKDVQIPSKGGLLKVHGFIDSRRNQHDVYVSATDLLLDKFDTAQLEQNDKKQLPFKAVQFKCNNNDVLLTGKVDLDAHFKAENNREQTSVSANLKNNILSTGGQLQLANGLNGTVCFDGKQVKFNSIAGVLSSPRDASNTIAGGSHFGSFTINGRLGTDVNDSCNIKFSGQNLDIASLVSFTKSAHIPVSESTVGPIKGLARKIDITIEGKPGNPALKVALLPDDMSYAMDGSSLGGSLKPLRISGGSIVFDQARLEIKDVSAQGQTGKLSIGATFTGQGDRLIPRYVNLKSTGIELPELAQYLNSKSLSPSFREAFARMSETSGLTALQGKIYGDLKVDMGSGDRNEPPRLHGLIGLNHVSGRYGASGQLVEHISGLIAVSCDQLMLQGVSATFGASHVLLNGEIKKVQSGSPSWQLEASGHIRPQDLIKYMSRESLPENGISISSDAPLTIRSTIYGEKSTLNKIDFHAHSQAGGGLSVRGAFGNLAQPQATPMTMEGVFTLSSPNPQTSMLTVSSCQVSVGDSLFQSSGTYRWSKQEEDKAVNAVFSRARWNEPHLDWTIVTPNAVPADRIIQMLNPKTDVDGVGGRVKLSVSLAGAPGNLLSHGDIAFTGVAVPSMHLKDLNGHIHTPRWTVAETSAAEITAAEFAKSSAQISLSKFQLGAMPLKDFEANIVLLHSENEPKIVIKNGSAALAGGKMTLNMIYGTQTSKWHVDLGLKQLQIDEFISNLIEHSGEITGLADGKISLESVGAAPSAHLKLLNGHGEISIYKGKVPKVGQLQEKLTHSNLFQQGVFGFNLNNVVQSVLPVKTGNFDQADMTFQVKDGVLEFDPMTFDGNDLRLRAAGRWDLVNNDVSFDVAGNIPRVSSSILPGAVGEVSRQFTLQKAVRVVTFRKLGNLPSLPILGDIGSDDRRAFTFKVAAELNNPDELGHSIQKTFKWLPNKPNASAHPIPGLNFEINLKPSAWLGLYDLVGS